ncbi:unnamed protein product, partial [marine sediment metagenome]
TVKIIELAPLFDFNKRLNAIWEEIKAESTKQNLAITKDDQGDGSNTQYGLSFPFILLPQE